MTNRFWRILSSLSVICVLGGCLAPKPIAFGPVGDEAPYGYRDRRNADGGHVLLVIMPAYVLRDEVRAYWDRRAAELCPAGVAKTNIFRADMPTFTNMTYDANGIGIGHRAHVKVELEGYLYCKGEGEGAPLASISAAATSATGD